MSETKQNQASAARPDFPAGAETLRILLIDGDPAYRALCQRYLKRCGTTRFDIVAVPTAEQGLRELEKSEFDCVLVDYALPDVHRTRFVQSLRDVSTGCSPPTVILTAQGGPRAAEDAASVGAAVVLPKRSVSPDSLTHAILNAVEQSPHRNPVATQSTRLPCARSNTRAEQVNDDV